MSRATSSVFDPDLRNALVAMVRKRVPEREVEDIVQATLTDAIESPHAPKDSESLRRWIFGVAKNKVVDFHRRAGRETFEVPEVAGNAAPHTEADLLRWAEKHLPPGEENKATLDWMLREGEGEKLEWIADDANVPAPRVRQRVSRLRRHLKTHWQKEVALLAALGVLVSALFLYLRPKPQEIANEDVPRAEEMRKHALENCQKGDFKPCLEGLDAAKKLDAAGDTRPEIQNARKNATEHLDNNTPPPAPTPTTEPAPPPSAEPTSKVAPFDSSTPPPFVTAMKEAQKPKAKPVSTEAPGPAPAPTPMPSSFPETKGGGTKGASKSIAPVDVVEGVTKPEPPATKKKSAPSKPSPKPSSTDDFGSSL